MLEVYDYCEVCIHNKWHDNDCYVYDRLQEIESKVNSYADDIYKYGDETYCIKIDCNNWEGITNKEQEHE